MAARMSSGGTAYAQRKTAAVSGVTSARLTRIAEKAMIAAPATPVATGRRPSRWSAGGAVKASAVELVQRARLGRLVVAPAQDLRVVADAPVAHVVERDLDDQLRPQRDPREVLPLRPAAPAAAAPAGPPL